MPSIALFVYCNLGRAYQNLGNFSKALEHHKEHRTMAKEVGNRAGECHAYGNLGIAYRWQGDYAKAIEYHAQDLTIAKEVGDRAWEVRVHGNLGIAYRSQEDFSKAIECHAQDLAIVKEVGGGGQGVRGAYDNLGTFHMHLIEQVKPSPTSHELRSTTCLGDVGPSAARREQRARASRRPTTC
jgi:tetratricopeptide (TPR) repeat protein